MTHSEFDQLTFSEKLPFRVIEALRQVLVHEIPAGDAIRNCGLKSQILMKFNNYLKNIKQSA